MTKTKRGNNMLKFEADFAFADETLEEVLARMGKEVPEAHVRIIELFGCGGGWPTLEIVIPEESLSKFAKWYCADDAAMWEEIFLEESMETL